MRGRPHTIGWPRLPSPLFNLQQHSRFAWHMVASVMHVPQRQPPDSGQPDNVDRRKGFLDIVERLSQGVVAVTLDETAVRNSGEHVHGEPTHSPGHKTDNP